MYDMIHPTPGDVGFLLILQGWPAFSQILKPRHQDELSILFKESQKECLGYDRGGHRRSATRTTSAEFSSMAFGLKFTWALSKGDIWNYIGKWC